MNKKKADRNITTLVMHGMMYDVTNMEGTQRSNESFTYRVISIRMIPVTRPTGLNDGCLLEKHTKRCLLTDKNTAYIEYLQPRDEKNTYRYIVQYRNGSHIEVNIHAPFWIETTSGLLYFVQLTSNCHFVACNSCLACSA